MFYNVLVFFPENTELYLPNKRARKRTFQPTDKICKEGEHFMVITLDIYLFNQTMIRSCCNRLRKQKKKTIFIKKVLQPNWGIPIVCCASVKPAL